MLNKKVKDIWGDVFVKLRAASSQQKYNLKNIHDPNLFQWHLASISGSL